MLLPRRDFSVAALFLLAVVSTIATTNAANEPSPEKEAELIALLQSDAAPAAKALACKNLAVHGSNKAVPELAKLLSNPQLASWARIPLEVIPGSEADEALRQAAESLEGNLLIGTINSIGVRRDSSAVELLTKRLTGPDADVASAAAVALGHIGNSTSVKALTPLLATAPAAVRSAVAEGCVLAAERSLSEGRDVEAVAIYDEIRKSDLPKQRILEATRGSILARGDKGIPLLIEQFQSPDKELFAIALSTAREFSGKQVDEALATEMARATPEHAALIIGAMADRPQTVVLPAIVKAAGRGSKPIVRIAAISALGRVGNPSCLPSLLESALEADAEISSTAKKSLIELPGESVDQEIVARLAKPEGKVYPLLLDLIGQRRISALPILTKALDHSDRAVRSSALTSLGATVPPDKLSVLVKQVLTPKHAEDAPVAQAALKTASIRMPDREVCATELAAATERASVPTKIVLLKILGEVAGTKALQTIATAAKSNDPQLQDVASELLGEWMTIDAAPVLLDLSKSAPAEKFQIRAMRGYIKIARQFAMPEKERIEICEKAFAACRRTAEQKMVLDVFKRYPNTETLRMAIKAIPLPELKDDAYQATLVIAQKLGGNPADVQAQLANVELQKTKLEIVKAEYGAGTMLKDVTEILKKQVVDTPLITLPAPTYNDSFGGDPAPGAAKKLKVQYKVDDKQGELTFAENALLIFPTPVPKK